MHSSARFRTASYHRTLPLRAGALLGFGLLSFAQTPGTAPASDPASAVPASALPANAPTDASDGEGPAGATPAPDLSFREALMQGRFWVDLRYRLESVSDDAPATTDTAYASTLRTVLGYETAAWKGMQGMLEFENVSGIGNMLYSTSPAGVLSSGYPIVADPTGTSINRVYWDYVGVRDTHFKVGRQYIKYDNVRWVGNVAWRQKYQTFDAVTLQSKRVEKLDVSLAYADKVNRVTRAILDTNTALANVAYDFGDVGRLIVYDYYLDFDQSSPALSSNSIGARFVGKPGLDENLALLYQLEFANQQDIGDQDRGLNENYYLIDLGVKVSKVSFRVGLESLGGDGSVALQTPLATLHAHNGWADRFLVTPTQGLQDLYLNIGGPVGERWSWGARLHDFTSTTEGLHYGSELDLLATCKVVEHGTVGVKAAFYSGDEAGSDPLTAFDTTKAWVWMQYSW